MHICGPQRLARHWPSPVADEHRLVFEPRRRHAVAASNLAGIERHHVKESAKTEFLLDQSADRPAFRPEKSGIEKELARVVSRLAVNVHSAGEVGGQPVVEPERVSEPGVAFRHYHELPRSGMIETDRRALLSGNDSGGPRM